jgi:hypothetical protein
MKILVTGSHGFIGSKLVSFLEAERHEVVRLDRKATQPAIEAGLDAVVHLAGEPITGRWTARKKRRIRESRLGGTRQLCEVLATLERRPRVLVSASEIGYYGDRGTEPLSEDSPAGTGFLAEVCHGLRRRRLRRWKLEFVWQICIWAWCSAGMAGRSGRCSSLFAWGLGELLVTEGNFGVGWRLRTRLAQFSTH